MMKYLLAIAAVAVLGLGYFVLAPDGGSIAPVSAPPPATAPTAPAPVAPVAITPPDPTTPAAPVAVDDNARLENMVAGVRQGLPTTLSDTLSMTDAVFLPRLRIIEYTYVTSAADARAEANALRATIEGRAQTICLDSRSMFELGVTLRNSFEDRSGTLLQRSYLLPEECERFY